MQFPELLHWCDGKRWQCPPTPLGSGAVPHEPQLTAQDQQLDSPDLQQSAQYYKSALLQF